MCKSPLARCEKLGETYINKQGKISHYCDFISWADVERNLPYYKAKYKKVDMIPCGKCKECRLQKSRDVANQMTLEGMLYPEEEKWFVTLTYNDENLNFGRAVNVETGEITEPTPTLSVTDAQKFIRALRDKYAKEPYKVPRGKIRYVIVGEYGSQTRRPHYHAIIYGLPLDQTKLKFYKHNNLGQSLWTHEDIEKVWKKGFVTVARVTWEDCAYVARYTMKKQYGESSWYYEAQGIIPEFKNQSLKPAIGRGYLLKHIDEIIQTDTIPIANKKSAQLVPPPKSFDRYMEKTYPELFEENKRKRKHNAEVAQQIKNQNTDLTPQQQREVRAQKIEERTKSLIRKEI